MSKHLSYKHSGLEWLGDIPEHWELKRFKYCFKNGKGLSITKSDLLEEGIPCVSYGEIHSKFGFEVDPDKNTLLYVNEEYLETNKSSLLKYGDFVFADTSEDIEGAGNFTHLASEKKVFAGYHTVICRLSIKSNPRFFAYAIDSISFRTQIRRKVQGVKVYSITNKILKDTILWFPEIKEQNAIAKYLDEKTSKLDLLISNKKEQIKRLKEIRQIEINTAVTKGLDSNVILKPTGVDWLGDVPEHWNVKRLKNISTNVQTGTTPKTAIIKYYENEDIKWFTPVDFTKNIRLTSSKSKISQIAIDEGAGRLFPAGSVLLLGIGATIGKVGLITEDSSSNQQINCVTFSSRMDSLFAAFCLKIYESEIIKFANFSTMPIFNQSNTTNLKIGVPPLQEQKIISEYLDNKTSKIDQLVSNLKNQINQLQEIRKIEIYNAVTGKIKVA